MGRVGGSCARGGSSKVTAPGMPIPDETCCVAGVLLRASDCAEAMDGIIATRRTRTARCMSHSVEEIRDASSRVGRGLGVPYSSRRSEVLARYISKRLQPQVLQAVA